LKELLDNPYSQITFPSKLLFKYSSPTAASKQEQLSSIEGQAFEALKYIPISQSGQVHAILEIGWKRYQDAQLMHENDVYLRKKED